MKLNNQSDAKLEKRSASAQEKKLLCEEKNQMEGTEFQPQKRRGSSRISALEHQQVLLEEMIKMEQNSFDVELAKAVSLLEKFTSLEADCSKENEEQSLNRLLEKGMKEFDQGLQNQALETYFEWKLQSPVEASQTASLKGFLWAHYKASFESTPSEKKEHDLEEIVGGRRVAFLAMCGLGSFEQVVDLFIEIRGQEVSSAIQSEDTTIPKGSSWLKSIKKDTSIICDVLEKDWSLLTGVECARPGGNLTRQRSNSLGLRLSFQNSKAQFSIPQNSRSNSSTSLTNQMYVHAATELSSKAHPWTGVLPTLDTDAICQVISQVYLKGLAQKASCALISLMNSCKAWNDPDEVSQWVELEGICTWIERLPGHIMQVTPLYPGLDSQGWLLLPKFTEQESLHHVLQHEWVLLLASEETLASMLFGDLFCKMAQEVFKEGNCFSASSKNAEVFKKLVRSFISVLNLFVVNKKLMAGAVAACTKDSKENEESMNPVTKNVVKVCTSITVLCTAAHEKINTALGFSTQELTQMLSFLTEVRTMFFKASVNIAMEYTAHHSSPLPEDISIFNITSALDEVVLNLLQAISRKTRLFIETYLLPEVDDNSWKHHQPFMRHSRCSHGVRAWALQLRTLASDLAPCLQNSDSVWAFKQTVGTILEESLLCLTSRYLCIAPSRARMKQYRIDLGYIVVNALIMTSLLEYYQSSPFNNCQEDDDSDSDGADLASQQDVFTPFSFVPPACKMDFLSKIYGFIHVLLTIMVLITSPHQEIISFLERAQDKKSPFLSVLCSTLVSRIV